MHEVVEKQKSNAAPTVLDRVIAWLAPRAGVERLKARAELTATESRSTGGYKGGRRRRRATAGWRGDGGSADADTLPDLPDLRSRSRDLVRNAPIATAALNNSRLNIVGSGLRLNAEIDRDILGLDEDQANAWERAAEREWDLIRPTLDWTGVQREPEMQGLAIRSILESGDLLAIRRYALDPGDVYGTKVQFVEADRIGNPGRKADTKTEIAGVQIDERGRHIAYHVYDRHPGDRVSVTLDGKWIPARMPDGTPQTLFLYDRLRPGQTRGVPWLAPIIDALKQLDDYADAEVRAAVVSSMYTVFITAPAHVDEDGQPLYSDRDENSSRADNEIGLSPGAIHELLPGESISTADPKRPNDKFEPFVLAFLKQIGAALGVPFEVLIAHFSASYSASRAALEMAWQFYRDRRNWLAARLCQPVYEWMLDEAVLRGRLQAPGYFADPRIRAAWRRAQWIGPSRISLDPFKEARADEILIDMGAKTIDQVCQETTGGTFESKADQRARETTRRRADGVDQSDTKSDRSETDAAIDADNRAEERA